MRFPKKLAIVMLILILPTMVLAQGFTNNNIPDYMGNAPNWGSSNDLIAFVKILINWFFYALLIIALFMLIWVGYIYVTSGGDTKKTGKAASNLGYILMGIAIALIAKGLIYVVCNIVTGASGICTF